MGAFFKGLKRVEVGLLTLLMLAMVAVAFMQVIFRIVLKSPIAWSEEFSRYVFIWIVFIGGAWAVSKDGHFRMDFLLSITKGTIKKIIMGLSYICMLIFAGLLVVYGTRLVNSVMTQTSPALHISMSIPYAALPVSGVLIILHTIELLWTNQQSKTVNEEG